MSGITPVLDTLLHQVLGRRVDIPLSKDLNQPAGPVVPVEGARPLHSDSRLDARGLPLAQDSARPGQAQAAHASLSRSVAGGAPSAAPAGSAAPSSTITSFSAAARAIADLLQRFPVPASAIAPATPLLAEAPGEALAAALIASRLQQSIQHSGLFYESHVARWYRGELPLEALRHEPQMQVVSRGVVGSAPAAPLPGGVPLPQSGVSGVVAQATPAETAFGRESGVAAAGEQADAEVPGSLGARAEAAGVQQESLSSLLRQQLELLAVPQLRWEGNVWVGVFMSLVIEARQASEGPVDEEGGAATGDRTAEREWKVRLRLRLSGHGALEASISLQGEHLALTLHSESAGLRRYFEDTRSDLRERLAACGFCSVHLQLHEAPAEDASHG